MTLRYVAHSWDVPPDVVGDALGLRHGDGLGRTRLADIAQARGVALSALLDELSAAIARHRAEPSDG